jgi:hypothetical protein
VRCWIVWSTNKNKGYYFWREAIIIFFSVVRMGLLFFFIVGFPCMLIITQLLVLFQQNALVFYH